MTDSFRFPIGARTVNLPAETDQIIAIANSAAVPITGIAALSVGGIDPFTDITPWHSLYYDSEAPYCDIVIEFSADAPTTIGDGTANGMIGLYGEINTGPGAGRYLLGVLGTQLAAAKPQIPIVVGPQLAIIGYAQVIQHVAVYDGLSVGGVLAGINVDVNLTIRVRPIRRKFYAG